MYDHRFTASRTIVTPGTPDTGATDAGTGAYVPGVSGDENVDLWSGDCDAQESVRPVIRGTDGSATIYSDLTVYLAEPEAVRLFAPGDTGTIVYPDLSTVVGEIRDTDRMSGTVKVRRFT